MTGNQRRPSLLGSTELERKKTVKLKMTKDRLKMTKDDKRFSPLIGVASFLSVASMCWTTWSLLDLIDVGIIGWTVALTADLIWATVIYCEYKGIGNTRWVKAVGWIAVIVVGGFIVYHGLTKNSIPMAVAGPFLTLGTKVAWEMYLLSVKDRTALTSEQRAVIDEKRRAIKYDTELARVETDQEIAELDVDAERRIAEIKARHRIQVAELMSKQEVLKAKQELDERMADSGYTLVRNDQVIQGETVPQPLAPVPVAPQLAAARPQPATMGRQEITLSVVGLTEAQQKLKRLAAGWYLAEAAAKANGESLSQARYAEDIAGVHKNQVTRAIQKFPVESMTPEDYDEARTA